MSLVEEDSCNRHGSRESGTFMERHKQSDNQLERMMMISFIPINCGLVPLIEGLCAQIL